MIAAARDRRGDPASVLEALDVELARTGASVGDSEAWLVGAGTCSRLTRHQVRKPLLGSGRADVIPFAATLSDETLLVASDGLFRPRQDDIAVIAASRSPPAR